MIRVDLAVTEEKQSSETPFKRVLKGIAAVFAPAQRALHVQVNRGSSNRSHRYHAMANIYYTDTAAEEITKGLGRAFQSGNVNFLLGSGASHPAIPAGGAIEQEIDSLLKQEKIADANKKIYELISAVQKCMNSLIGNENKAEIKAVLESYEDFLSVTERLLIKRYPSLLSRQVAIFTTNYDLFIEKASEKFPSVKFNDGFTRTPSLQGEMKFSSQNFFNSFFNVGNLYAYKVEVPSINLLKLHGSFSWEKQESEIAFKVATRTLLDNAEDQEIVSAYVRQFALVFPQKSKFSETVLDRVYYDLLRIFSNQLDKENTLLIAFGFSFEDKHIYDITCRALRNPTLRVVIFAFDEHAASVFSKKFASNSNVQIISPPAGQNLDFARFNEILRSSLPKDWEKK